MKKTVRESVIDYDMATLRALAEARGAVLTSNHQATAADQLAAQLSDATSVAITLTELPPAEMDALSVLQAMGGWMEMHRFARPFGAVRAMGSARLERERPWLSPVNPAEGLWYRGLIFKGFRQTETGVAQVVYIPDDLLPLLPELSSDESSFTLEPTSAPPHILAANANLVEDMLGVLVYVRNHDVRPAPDGSPRLKDLHAMNALCVSPVPASSVAGDDHLDFVLHLCRALDLVTVTQGRLALNPDPARTWLEVAPARSLLNLQTVWRDDPDWNDLWHVPSLKPQSTGWKNDPILARRKLLDFLAGCRLGVWYPLDGLVAALKLANPDFQRPDGDYSTWYIQDLNGQSLMGFEHWDEVEGALIRYLVPGPLQWLGITDLGFEENLGSPIAFRLAETGLALLGVGPPPETSHTQRDELTSTPILAVRNDFTLRVSANASLYDRFQLSRFADFVGREEDRVSYRISPASLTRARRQGITGEQVSAFLERTSGQQVPTEVLDSLGRWYNRSGAVRLERGVILRVDHPEMLTALRRDPIIAPLLGEILGPRAVLVPESNAQQVRRWLVEQGYLATDK